MKVSKTLWVEKGVHPNSVRAIKRNKRSSQKLYIVCTSYHQGMLFDIIESQYISSKYDQSYMLAIARSKTKALEQVYQLVDTLYNEKTTTYEALKTE